MTAATLARRLGNLEASQSAAMQRRHDDGMRALRETMAPEHIQSVRTWMREHVGGTTLSRHPGEAWHGVLERLNPPALVRACWLLVAHHMNDGTPVSLTPAVAEVYLGDPDAFPVTPCDGCGYLLPARAKVRPGGVYELLPGWYLGTCPVCGLDSHPEEAEDA